VGSFRADFRLRRVRIASGSIWPSPGPPGAMNRILQGKKIAASLYSVLAVVQLPVVPAGEVVDGFVFQVIG